VVNRAKAIRIIAAAYRAEAQGYTLQPKNWGLIWGGQQFEPNGKCLCPLGALLLTHPQSLQGTQVLATQAALLLEVDLEWVGAFVRAIDQLTTPEEEDEPPSARRREGYATGEYVRRFLWERERDPTQLNEQ
jgi:hypothetical protein